MSTAFGGINSTTLIPEVGDVADISCDAYSTVNQNVPNAFFTPLLLEAEYFDTNAMHDVTVQDSGTATSGAATTLTDTGQSWITDQYKDMVVSITGGTGSGQVRRITTNSATVLTVANAWTTNPDATSTYEILISNRITVPSAGKYLIASSVVFSADATGLRGWALYHNTTFIFSVFDAALTVETFVRTRAILLDMAANDYVEIRGYQSSGGVLTTLGASKTRGVNLTCVKQRG